MKYNLFLDDERIPTDVTWVEIPRVFYEVVRDYDEFVETILTYVLPCFVTFDHDLADTHYAIGDRELYNSYTTQVGDMKMTFDYGPEKTGFDCAKWLVEYCIDNRLTFPEYVVHSMNPVGSKRITDYIIDAKKHTDI